MRCEEVRWYKNECPQSSFKEEKKHGTEIEL